MDYNHNRLYFQPTPEKRPEIKDAGEKPSPEGRTIALPFLAIVIGITVTFICLVSGTVPGIFVGLGVIVSGIFWCNSIVISNSNARTTAEEWHRIARLNAEEANIKYREEADEFNRSRTIVTGAELDKIVHAYVNESLADIALRELGIGKDQEWEMNPICIHDYYHEDIPGAEKVRHRQGEDGKHRTSNYNVVMLFFTAKQAFYYELKFSLLDANRQETTTECFYEDIVAIETTAAFVFGPATVEEKQDDETEKQVKIESRIGLKNVKLTTSGGTSISVMLSEAVAGGDAVQLMKQVVRKKKNQA